MRNALKSSAGTVLSRILGLFRDILCAAIFSTQVTDAWAAAFRLPNLMRRLLGEGALSISFIPTFLKIQNESGLKTNQTLQFVNGFYTLFLGWIGTLSVLAWIGAEPLLRFLLDSQYVQNFEAFSLTLDLFRIMVGFFFFLSLYAFWMGLLNAFGKFGRAALAPAAMNLVMILFMLLPRSWFGVDGYQLGFGVLVGGLVQSVFLIPALQRLQYLPVFHWPSAETFQSILGVFKNMLPAIMAVGLLHFMNLINLKWSSAEGSGAISAFYYADRLLELPLSLISVSLGAALLPQLSDLWSQKRTKDFTLHVSHFMKMNLLVAIPAALGLWFLAEPIVQFLFERGEFQATQTQLTFPLVKYSALVLLSFSVIRILTSTLFAMQKYWVVACLSFASLFIHMLVAVVFYERIGLKGLILSVFVSSLFCLLGLVWYFHKILKFNSLKMSSIEVLQILFANLIVFVICFNHAVFPHVMVTILLTVLTYGILIRFFRIKLKL